MTANLPLQAADQLVVSDYEQAALWVSAHGGSCTSPLAVEFGFEDEWRVMTLDGPRAVQLGQTLAVTTAGRIEVRL